MTKLHKLWPHYWKPPPKKRSGPDDIENIKGGVKLQRTCVLFCVGVSPGSPSCPLPASGPSETLFSQPRAFSSLEKGKESCKAEPSAFAPGAPYTAWRPSCPSPSTLHPSLLWLTHLYSNKTLSVFFFPNPASRLNTNITNVLSFVWRERESPAAERAENKNTYVTSPLAEAKKKGAPPICFALRSEALWVVLARPLWGSRQSNNNEGGFGENKARKCFWSENTTAPT